MTITGWSLVRFLHVTAAMGWVGGQLLLSGVVLPVLRSALDPVARAPIVHTTAKRFALVSNAVLLPALVGTGLALVNHRGISRGTLGENGYGRLFAVKLALVVTSIVLAGAHGALASRRSTGARPAALAGVASSLGVVLFATALVP